MMKAAKILQKVLSICGLGSIIFVNILVLLLFVSNIPCYAQGIQDNDPHATGLILPTSKEIAEFKKTHGKVVKVLPNKIALERANKGRAKKGLPLLPEDGAVPFGKEIISSKDDVVPEADDIITQEIFSTDNSASPAFPVIRSQGGLSSCCSFAITYYHLTYTAGGLYGWDNKNEDNTTKFSPRWTYNMVNRGENDGSSFFENYDVLEEHGAATWEEFRYDGRDYLKWCLDAQTWDNATKYRINPVEYVDVDESDPDPAITQIKQILAGGNILTFGTYISSWQYMTIKDNPGATEDDPYIGEDIGYWVGGQLGGHAMTIVDYNDTIWADIDKDQIIDDGELGAFLIANSWGDRWRNAGFIWLSYDAFGATSAVPGGPGDGRVGAIVTGMVFDISLKYQLNPPVNTPKMLAEFNVSHTKRNQLRISLGISDTQNTVPDITWYPGAINLQGGPYNFIGKTTESNGTFVFDFTDILPGGYSYKRYYLGVYDSADGYPATLYSFKIIDKKNGSQVLASYLPPATDNGQVYAYLDYEFTNDIDNSPPIAVASASPESGTVPLEVAFNGSGSYDTEDGYNLAKYFWNFGDRIGPPGDRSGASGEVVTHTYYDPGIYSAKLTVTDNSGATSSTALTITATAGDKPMHVSSIIMSVTTRGKNKYAEATVYIVDPNNQAVSGATVTGNWSGLANGSDTGLTDNQGKVTLSSDNVSKNASGEFEFCVSDVTLDGYTYDPDNSETCDSVTTP